MTYRDPDSPLGEDAPTEAYRAPDDGATEPTGNATAGVPPASSNPWLTPPPAPAEPAPAAPPSAEPAATDSAPLWPASTAPAVPPSGGGGRGSRVRWAVALVVVALVVVASGVAAVLLTGRAPDAQAVGWVPDDAIAYGEIRLDLPGDQKANLGEFLSKFPGFDDQAAIDTKLDEAFDQLISRASNGESSYTGDIKPWFDGEIAFSLGSLPPAPDLTDPRAMPEVPEVAFYVSINDRSLAKAWFDDGIADASPTTETYSGVELTIVKSEMADDPAAAMAYGFVTDSVLVLGQVDAVKAVVDTKGEGGLADDEDFTAALAAADQDHVGFMYFNMRSYVDWAMDLQGEIPVDQCGSGFSDEMAGLIPAWGALEVRIEGDALVTDLVAPMVEDPPFEQENHASGVLDHVPASAIAVFEGHDVGESITSSIDLYRDDPNCAEAFRQIDTAVGLLGGFDGILGWMEDAAIVVNRTDDGVEGGLVVQASNTEDAGDLLASLRSFINLGGAQAGISSREETHGDTTITVLDLGPASQFWAGFAMSSGMDVEPPGGPDARIELAWAQTDDIVVLGVGTGFVKHVLDTDEGTSLAGDDRFTGLLGRTGAANGVGVQFVDLAAIREMVEDAIRSQGVDFSEYEREVKPFLLPFDAYLQASTIDGDRAETRILITIK
jgi:hypothetical protein